MVTPNGRWGAFWLLPAGAPPAAGTCPFQTIAAESKTICTGLREADNNYYTFQP